ncbi:MAG: KaiC, partial [uncultured archaeon A07HR67]
MPELIKTGIEGLDDILNGGIVENSTTLISGNPGAGKTIFGLQYIYNGVEEHDQNGIYLTFEEDRRDLREAANSIGFDNWQQHVEEG